MQQAIRTIHIDDALIDYIVALIDKTRQCRELQLAASPRASLALMQTSAAYAFIRGRDYVIPEDVQRMFEPVVSHRLVLTAEAKIEQKQVDEVVTAILRGVKAPLTQK